MTLLQTKAQRFFGKLDDFLTTAQYIAMVMLLALLSNVFGLELPVYILYTVAAVYILLFGRDLLPLLPLVVASYITPSVHNNPGKNPDSIFFGTGGVIIAGLVCVIFLCCLVRIIRRRKDFFGRRYKLLSGLLLLGAAYLLGGIGTPDYVQRLWPNLRFSLLQIAVLLIPYLLFGGGVDWKRARRDYLAWTGFFMGGVLLLQVLWIYLSANVIIDGVIHREQIYTGWGIHNNLGAMLAMMIPFSFYLATKYRRGWMGTVVGSAFLLGVFLTCSRNAMLTGSAFYLMGIVLMLYYAQNRKANTIAALVCIGIFGVSVILFSQQILTLFSDILSLGFDPNSRDSLYHKGMLLFQEYPLFGGSFFSPSYKSWGWSTVEGFTNFFPPRWHNTLIQMLASCGVVGLGAYLVHRVQTAVLFFKHHTKEKIFIGCSLLALLVCSLFDCHFFNLGPGLFYATALAFAENCDA